MRPLQTATAILAMCGLFTGCAVTTPEMSKTDIINRIALDREAMYKNQELVNAPITLKEAMARAIKYNLENRVKLMESALALRQSELITYDMLPRLVANAGYDNRDNVNGSSSANVITGEQSLVPSTSQDQERHNSDLTLSWNILDFGVSYFQAKQQADRAHIMKERQRKVVHIIIQQTRQAYWLALGAQQLEGRFEPLLKDVENALADIDRIEQGNLRPPLATLNYRKSLLETMRQLEEFRDQLAQAKPRLATLMNLPPGQPYVIAEPTSQIIPEMNLSLDTMEIRALTMRPELIEADYNERISINETRKTLARMLPGIEFNVGSHYDSNSFLVNNSWVEGGVRMTWNLMTLLSGPARYSVTKTQTEITKYQRLVLSAAIITQVHLSYSDFFSRKRQYELSKQLQDINTRIYEQIKNQAQSGSQNHLNEIRSASDCLMTTYQKSQSYASLQNAYEKIRVTLGYDPLPETLPNHDIKTLSEAIGARLYTSFNAEPFVMEPLVIKDSLEKTQANGEQSTQSVTKE
ncbi:TolC family protein [Desulforhopalus vacuolatus]|uniref:TolC family protein n=1 Tax=Desulforhopalus vacuolatus TaxID=40414 RepID=UPI0019655020|nr:TolC family protein [Desulforhopalus vacuolatus]MBM9519861.1 TolC family protein [Desulforhopalus vacuolatus]